MNIHPQISRETSKPIAPPETETLNGNGVVASDQTDAKVTLQPISLPNTDAIDQPQMVQPDIDFSAPRILSLLEVDTQRIETTRVFYRTDLEYHNWEHVVRVQKRMRKIVHNVPENDLVAGDEDRVNKADILIGLMDEAILWHDAGHQGWRFFQDYIAYIKNDPTAVETLTESLFVPDFIELGDLSAEELSAHLFRRTHGAFLQSYEVDIVNRMILATTHGQDSAESPEEYRRNYRPETNAEKIVAFADLAGFIDGTEKFIIDSIAVMAEQQRSGHQFPESLADLIALNLNGSLNSHALNAIEGLNGIVNNDYYLQLKQTLHMVEDNCAAIILYLSNNIEVESSALSETIERVQVFFNLHKP